MIGLPPVAATIPVSATATIKPIPGRRYRLTSEDVRDDGVVRRRFVQTTELVFHLEPAGWLVESTLVDLAAEPAGDDAAIRFIIGKGGLKGRTIRSHLDAEGRLLSIDDEDALWAALLASVTLMGNRRSTQQSPLVRDPSIPLRALPAAARRATIATAVRLAVPIRPTLGRRAITLSGLTPSDAALPGTQMVTMTDDTIRDETHAFLADGTEAQSLDRDRRINATTGLLIKTIETRTTRIGERVRTSQRTDTLDPVP